MPKEIKESQIKEFLKRVEVRTMRKDLQRLREIEALEEREKITKLKTGREEKKEKEKSGRLKRGTEERKKIFRKREGDEGKKAKVIEDIKKMAEESERQKILYLETEKLNLKKQLQELQKKEEPPLLLEKNKFLNKKAKVGKRLKGILKKEKKIEDEQKFISEKEKKTNIQGEKQKLEKRRWGLEEERKKIERKRWVEEREIEGLENQIKGIEENYQKVLTGENKLKERLKEIDISLKSIYEKIIEREEKKRQMEGEGKRLEALKWAEEESKRKEEIRRREWTRLPGSSKPVEKGLIGGLEKTSEEEEKERKKFMERVEKWTEKKEK